MNYTFYSISMLGFFLAGFSAIFVLARNPENQLNRAFFLFAAAVSLYNLTDAMMCIAGARDTADLYLRFTIFFWLIYLPLFLHFCMLLSGLMETMLGKTLVYIGYISALIMVYPSAFTNWIYDSVGKSAFGYHAGIGRFFLVLGGYSLIIVIQQAAVLGYTWTASKEQRKKDMSFILFIGLLSVGVFGTIFDVILPFLGFYVHSFIPSWITMFVMVFAYVMAKFGLMLVSPAQLASDILATMPDMMVFIDNNRYINMINEKVANDLGYTKEELVGKPIKEIFSGDIDCNAMYGIVQEKGSVRDAKQTLRKKNGDVVTVTMDATSSRDRFGAPIGCVIIFRDISEMEKLLTQQERTSKQLAEQVIELDKYNKLTMQREDKVIELKNKIKELEERLKTEDQRPKTQERGL